MKKISLYILPLLMLLGLASCSKETKLEESAANSNQATVHFGLADQLRAEEQTDPANLSTHVARANEKKINQLNIVAFENNQVAFVLGKSRHQPHR